MKEEIIIKVEGLWKRYGLPLSHAAKEKFTSMIRPRTYRDSGEQAVWALRDVSFEMRRGETLGVVGKNGAGKSTLLKVLAGVTPPTKGKVEVRGEIFPMIDLNAGMHMELTGRENVRLLAAVMGFTRKEIESRMRAIEEFCELGEWLDRPVRMYSSGMVARLGFAVAMTASADILLIDEVFAVGDVGFQQKCYNAMSEIQRKKNTCIVFVSHAYRQVERLCERVLFLDKGRVIEIGECHKTLLNFMNFLQGSVKIGPCQKPESFVEHRKARVVGLEVTGPTNAQNQLYTGEDATIWIRFESSEVIPDAYFFVQILSQDGEQVSMISSRGSLPFEVKPGEGSVACRIRRLTLLPGSYLVTAGIGRHQFYQKIDKGGVVVPINVVSNELRYYDSYAGIVFMDAEWMGPKEH